IEGLVAEGERLLTGLDAGAVALLEEPPGGFGLDDHLDARHLAQAAPEQAVMGAEVERNRKAPLHGRQPLDQIVGHARKQELVVAGFGRDPVAPADQESAVEDVMLCGHGDNGFRWFTFLIPGLPALGLVPRVPMSSHPSAWEPTTRWIPVTSTGITTYCLEEASNDHTGDHRTPPRWTPADRAGQGARRHRRSHRAALLPGVPGTARRAPLALCAVLARGAFHPPAVVRRAGDATALRYGRAHGLGCRRGTTAGLRSRPGRGPLQRRHAHPHSPVQVRRSARRAGALRALAGRGRA